MRSEAQNRYSQQVISPGLAASVWIFIHAIPCPPFHGHPRHSGSLLPHLAHLRPDLSESHVRAWPLSLLILIFHVLCRMFLRSSLLSSLLLVPLYCHSGLVGLQGMPHAGFSQEYKSSVFLLAFLPSPTPHLHLTSLYLNLSLGCWV